MSSRALLAFALVGCKAELPPLSDANGVLDATCTGPFADTVVDTFPTSLIGTPALGAPDGTTVTLETDNVLTIGFVGLGAVTDQQGMDLTVHAMVDVGDDVMVQVADSDMQFHFAGDVTATVSQIDIAVGMVQAAVYARLIGVSGSVPIDAVEASHDACP